MRSPGLQRRGELRACGQNAVYATSGPAAQEKMKGCNFPYLMVIMTSLRCPRARFFYPELPPHLLTVAAKSRYDRSFIPLEGKLFRHTVITKGHLIKIDLSLLIGCKWQYSCYRLRCCGSDADVAVRPWCRLSRSERQRTFDLETALICSCRTATLDQDYHVYHYVAPSCVHISLTSSFLFTAKDHFKFPKRNWSPFHFILQVSQES